jgi:hypothetical protein
MPQHQHQHPARAPGHHDLPDLALQMPLQQALPPLDTPGLLATHPLRQQHLPCYRKARETRPRESARDAVPRTKDYYPGSAAANLHAGRGGGGGFDVGHTAQAPRKDAAAWPARATWATCASCSKWSLECIHAAAALNAFDELDSDPDARLAAPTSPQPKGVQNARAGPETARRHHRRHRERSAPPGPPMLQRWRDQSPHQESFHGVATTEAASPRTAMARL